MVKFFSTILYTLLITVIVGVAVLLLGSKLNIPGNVEMKIVKSGSMEPAIPTGSIVIVRPSAEYRFNDVITFGKDTKTDVPTTHRIIGVHGEGTATTYTVKGDANEEQDPNPVARRDVIGKVVLHVPYVGFLLDFARQPIGFALLIAVPAGLIILEELLTILRETRKWWRGGKGGGGGTGETLGAHLKLVYVKRRKMDEIFVPRVMERSRFARFLHADAYGTSTALVVGLIFASSLFSGASGGTLAYFQDIERSVGNIFQAGTWVEPADPQSVVLNEFLPRPNGIAYGFDFGNSNSDMPQGEWIELFNNGDVPINVNGWYMADASGGGGNTHAIISATNTQPATTTIPAHGWLVVYMNKPTLNQTGDEIHLFTDGDVLVDSVTYTTPTDGCFYEPTPTDENSTTTPTGTPGNGQNGDCHPLNLVPANKSYARIPDGTGDWVDPIPTPGTPNIPELPEPVMTDTLIEDEQEEVLGESDEKKDNTSPSGGGGGGGGGASPAPEDTQPEPEDVPDEMASTTPPTDAPAPPTVPEGEPEEKEESSGETPDEETDTPPPPEDPPADDLPPEDPPTETPPSEVKD